METAYTSTYTLVQSYLGDNLYITGSVALRLILQQANYMDLLQELPQPNDIDFLYTGRQTEEFRSTRIGDYVNERVPHRSVTFVNENGDTFDLTMVPSVKHVVINGMNVIDPRSLLKNYQDDDGENAQLKTDILSVAIERIEQNSDLSESLFYQQEQRTSRDFGSLSRSLF